MALVVEDGTGLANADSYISLADADTYISNYVGLDSAWDTASDNTKEVAARQATQYLDGVYGWKGQKETAAQALDWPREYVYDEDGAMISDVPTAIGHACAELMLLILNGTSITKNVTRSDQVKREKVDVVDVEYEVGAAQQPSFPVVNRLVSKYVNSSSKVVRA